MKHVRTTRDLGTAVEKQRDTNINAIGASNSSEKRDGKLTFTKWCPPMRGVLVTSTFGMVALLSLGCESQASNSNETASDASDETRDPDGTHSDNTANTTDSDQTAANTSNTTNAGSDAVDDETSEGGLSDTSNSSRTSDEEATTHTPPGDGPMLGSCPLFPADNAWNTDISDAPLHPNSDAFIDSIGRDTNLHPDFGTEWEGAPIGIPYVVVDASQQAVDITYTAYGDESDPGPMPIPEDAPIEGGEDGDGDRHAIVVDQDSCTLYELYRAFPTQDGFEAESGTVWDLRLNEDHPEGCTSADAAGLPIFPGLVRYDEVVERREVLHALRFTVSQSQRGYIYPARHYASDETNEDLAPMGLRVRMKAGFECGSYSDEVRVLCSAMKRFGMIVADNGSDWYVSGAPDPRWSDDNLGDLKDIPGDAFEVVDTGPVVTDSPDCNL
jgi:hypothetical protein